MNQAIRRRLEALEQQAGATGPQLDFSGLTRDERTDLRGILVAVTAGTMTPDEAGAEVERLGIGKR